MSLSPSDGYGSSHPEGQCPDSASGGTGLVPSRGALTGVGAGGENININSLIILFMYYIVTINFFRKL